MSDLTRRPPTSSAEPASPQPARGSIPAVPGAAPTGSVPRTPKYRCLTQVSYLSGRLAGLAGTNRYVLPETLRDELGSLAAIAETVFVLVEGLDNP